MKLSIALHPHSISANGEQNHDLVFIEATRLQQWFVWNGINASEQARVGQVRTADLNITAANRLSAIHAVNTSFIAVHVK